MITHGFLPQHELLRALGIFAALFRFLTEAERE
jgi:hypothetical protein